MTSEHIEATQALAELVQEAFEQVATPSALIDAIQNRTCHALDSAGKGIPQIEAALALVN